MDTLSDLISIVNKKRLSKIDVLDKTFLDSNSDNLYFRLYHAIESRQVKTDDDAGKLLYGTGKHDPRYKMLKSRLKDKVLKSVLLFNVGEIFSNDRGRTYYECLTHNQVIEVIIQITGTTKLVYELVKENYAKAYKYNFYEILKNYSYYLLSFYGLKGDDKAFLKEEENYLKYTDLARKEQFAKYLYMKSIVGFVGQTSITDELLRIVNDNVNRLYVLKEELKNSEIDFYYYYIALLYYENSSDLDQILNICDEADELMLTKPHAVTNNRKFVMLLYRIKALLNKKQFDLPIELLNNFDKLYYPTENLYNWYILKETEFKLYLQNNKIQEAHYVHKQVLDNTSYKRQAVELTEKWKIYHAYLVFMDSYLNKGDFRFNLAKFLNDVPVNSKDKSGYNFAIRIIEIFFYAARKQYNVVFAKMEALRVYRSRYLKDNTYIRNRLFLNLLLKSEKSGYDARVMKQAIWPEIDALRRRKDIIADWEIIPYEVLWDIFVELAKR